MTARAMTARPLTLSLSKGEPEPCPKLAAEILGDMARRAGEILGRDPDAELLAVEAELERRYGFTRAQLEAAAARAWALARKARLERAVAHQIRRSSVVRLPVGGRS